MNATGIGIWTQLLGLISAELFGQLSGSVTDNDAFFGHQVKAIITRITSPAA